MPTLPPTWRSPESSHTLTRSIVVLSLIVHASAALALRAGAAERTHLAPATSLLDIEMAPPPPPPPEPETPPPPPPPTAAPPPAPVHRSPRPQAKAPPPTSEQPPAATGWSEGDEGELPPAAPEPAPVAVAPPPPTPPAPPAPVIEAKEGANYLNNPRPPYPRLALREGWEGRVVLRVKVLPDGRVGGATVQKSAGRGALDDAALDIVKSWTFVPATQGGKPIAGWVAVPFDFKLN